MLLPYPLNVDESTGLITFTTEHAISYVCRFQHRNRNLSPILGIYDLEIYEFDFYHNQDINADRKGDLRISKTLCDLVEDYFIVSNKRVLVYVCDGIDEKQRHRRITFGKWYREFFSDYLIRIPITICIESYECVFGGILVRNDFPHMEVLEEELVNRAEGIVSEKYL